MSSFNNFARHLFVFLCITFSLGVHAQVERFVEGQHYTALPDLDYARTLDRTSGKADVMEVFWYGCAHCYAFDPVLETWAASHTADVNFSRSPLMVWSAINKSHARLYFTAQQLGKVAELHGAIFAEVQQNRNPLADKEAAAQFFSAHGVPADQFAAAYDSFATDSQLRKAETLQKQIRITAVPVMIVNGKYLVGSNEGIRTQEEILQVVEFLLAKEQAADGPNAQVSQN